MKLIGLMGLAGSGKSTVADMLTSDHRFRQIALADPMKEFCKEIFAFTDRQLYGPSEERNKPDPRYRTIVPTGGQGGGGYVSTLLTPRHALQTLGTEWGRACYENVWVDYALRKIKGSSRGARWVITDVRFQNEVDAIRAVGGVVWGILRHGIEQGTHVSETEQGKIEPDLWLFNDGTLGELRSNIKGNLSPGVRADKRAGK